ncbi:MAG: beta-lactamase family protein [Ignavibacteria bacterium]|nr:beta-lactamase family protein [Ignavibacteria bacterium]
MGLFEYELCDSPDLVAERASGKHIATLIREPILSPLGLNDVFFDVKENSPGPVAHRWFNGADVRDLRSVGLNTAGASAGALFSTSADMVRWYAAVLDGDLLDSTSFNELTSFVATPDRIPMVLVLNDRHSSVTMCGVTADYMRGHRSRMVQRPLSWRRGLRHSNSWPSGIEGVSPSPLQRYHRTTARMRPSITGPSSLCQGQRSATFNTHHPRRRFLSGASPMV